MSFLGSAFALVAFFGGIFVFVGDLNRLSVFTKTNSQLFQDIRRRGELFGPINSGVDQKKSWLGRQKI